MKKHLIRILSSLILFCIVFTAASCTVTDPNNDTTTESSPQPGGNSNAASDETTALSAETVLGKNNFGGETLTFYSRHYNGAWSSDLIAENTDGTYIVDAVYKRNSKLSELYGVEFDQIKSGKQAFRTEVANRISSNDTSYQALYMGLADAAFAAQSGYLQDMTELPNIDLEGKWWSQASNDDWSIGGAQYFATGDITHIDDMAIRATFFNKDILKQHGLTSIYDLVYADDWNFEKFFEYAAVAKKDEDGNGVMDLADTFGATAQPTFGFMLTMSAGEQLVDKDADDMPRLRVSTGSTRFIDVVTYLTDKIADNDAIYLGGDSAIINLFGSGQALFWTPVLLQAQTMRTSYDVKFGIAPMPKYNADQKEYCHYYNGYCVTVMCFPTTTKGDKLEMATFMVEAMAIDSISTLTPAYYDVCLKGRYADDAESAAMLDIVTKDVTSDFAEIFGWVGFNDAIEEAITNGNPIVSVLKSHCTTAQKAIQMANMAFEKLKG